ncbi:MAG TPA: HD domain-containing protein [Thermoanaerobaculia bacterium]
MLPKYEHEIRDPIHTFIRVSSDERKVIDSRPFQRLRDIHQLALTYLVYPAATHRRFEHSLGVMELAGRVFDVITRQENRRNDAREFFRPDSELAYWRTVVRMGALCHDVGHIPFSHGAEELLPAGYHHEHLSVDVILGEELTAVWNAMTPPIKPRDVAKVAVGLKAWPFEPSEFAPWDELMTEIVTGNAFGVDRIDYLLRDSHHAGVGYGRFDHHRLVDSLRVLRWREKPVIGIERGGMHAAEALQLARYFMFEQLYYHRVRRALDLHLRQFLRAWLPAGTYPIEMRNHLALTDNEVLAAMRVAADDPAAFGHDPARRILNREFYRVLYAPTAEDRNITLKPTDAIYRAVVEEFGTGVFEKDTHLPEAKPMEFAVESDFEAHVGSSIAESQVLGRIPAARYDFVFVIPEKLAEVKRWLDRKRIRGILAAAVEEEQ